jgi:hypothetical protein
MPERAGEFQTDFLAKETTEAKVNVEGNDFVSFEDFARNRSSGRR